MAPRRDRRRSQRGSALVEAAIVTPVFFAMIFGILEFGLLFRNSLTTNNAAQQGARAASVSGRSPDADYLILRSVDHGMRAMGLKELDVVVVFKASGPGSTVPAACLTASQASSCNRYTAADFYKEIENPSTGVPTGNFRCAATAVDRFWCPSSRVTKLSTGPDYVGVYVQTRHEFITGLFGDGRQLRATSIIRLEPDAT
jgi:TadE-like protein